MRRLVLIVLALGIPGAAAAQPPSAEELYGRYCIRCHGPEGVGRPELGPSLRGVGAQSADFYLRTGYMPLGSPEEVPSRGGSPLSDEEIDVLVDYVASLGDGPPVPEPRPERGDLSEGQTLFTEHCAGCHQILGEGGVVTGVRVPPLDRSTAVQIAEAVRIGPHVMPTFPEEQISDEELDSLIRYVQYAKSPRDEGGWGIGHIGPIPEGLVTWLLAGTTLVAVAVLIGRRAG